MAPACGGWGGHFGVVCWPETSANATHQAAVKILTQFFLQNQWLTFSWNCLAVSCQTIDTTNVKILTHPSMFWRRSIPPCQFFDTTVSGVAYMSHTGVIKMQRRQLALFLKKTSWHPCNMRGNHYIQIIAGWHDADRHHSIGELKWRHSIKQTQPHSKTVPDTGTNLCCGNAALLRR